MNVYTASLNVNDTILLERLHRNVRWQCDRDREREKMKMTTNRINTHTKLNCKHICNLHNRGGHM
jgi:hypothetical protein